MPLFFSPGPAMRDSASKMISSLFAERRVFSVSELTGQIKEVIEVEFADLEVQGEVSNFKRHTSGHWYFTLKDADAQLRSVFFKQWNRLLRFAPENGLEVRVRGRLSVYALRGEYELLVETMEPVGIGVLQLAFEQQLRRLAAEGLFAEERKRKPPLLPRRIGVVTAPTGAAVRDIIQVLARRHPSIPILIAPTRVQGRGAAAEIAEAINLFNRFNRGQREDENRVDVIILARGGGSMEDLWSFNEEVVARAIYNSQIPIISAVGHESDFTIADFVADLRAPTPSAAAEMVAPAAIDLRSRVQESRNSLIRVLNYYLLRRRSDLRELVMSRGFTEAADLIRRLAGRWRELELRAARALEKRTAQSRRRLRDAERQLIGMDLRDALKLAKTRRAALERRLRQSLALQIGRHRSALAIRAGQLEMLSPLSVLARGYLLAQDPHGRLKTRAAQLQAGDKLRLRFADGEVSCQVQEGGKIYAEDESPRSEF
jgi:exodeoxyribonuclease VII large subunit